MTDNLFHICDGEFVITHRKGVFYQRQVYHRAGRLFVRIGSGFAALLRHGTSGADEAIDDWGTVEPVFDKLGRAVRK